MPFRRVMRGRDDHITASVSAIPAVAGVLIARQICVAPFDFTQFGRRTICTPLNAGVSIA